MWPSSRLSPNFEFEGLQGLPPRQGSTASGRAESGGLRGFHPGQSFQPSHQLIAVTPAPGGDPQDFIPATDSEEIFGGGRPGGGPQNSVPGQSSTELGGADDDDELIRRSNELLEYTRREYLFSSDEEEEDEEEEETEEEQPLRFQGHFRPRRFCSHFFQGQCWRSRPRTTSSTRTCRDSGDAPVIMQPEFQQSCWPRSSSTTMTCSWLVLFVAMQIMLFSLWFSAGPGRAHRRQRQWYGSRFFHALCSTFGWPCSSSITAVVWLAGFALRCVPFECRQALAALIVDNGSATACWFYLALCSLRLMAGCRARRRHRQCYVHGWLCRYAVFFVCRPARDAWHQGWYVPSCGGCRARCCQ